MWRQCPVTLRFEVGFKSRSFLMPDLSIGEVARRAGLRTSAIRYYEKVGLLPRAPRVSRQRRYEPQILDRLAVVRFAQFVGLRLSEIKWLLNDVPGRPPPERWRRLARQRPTRIDTLMAEIGTSLILIPNGLSAFSTARMMAPIAAMVPPSPAPFTPSGLSGEAVSV